MFDIFRGKVVKEGTQWDLKQVAVHVIFPPDAVPEDRTLTLLRWNPHARCPPLLHHEAIVSDVIELSAVDSTGILHFNKAVTIVIPHCASNLKGYEVVIKTLVNSETNEWDDSVETEDVRTQDGENLFIYSFILIFWHFGILGKWILLHDPRNSRRLMLLLA